MDHYTSQDSTLIIFQYYVWTLHSKWILLIGQQDLTKSHTKCPLSGFRDLLMLLTVTVTDINIDGGFCLLQGYALRKERSLTIAQHLKQQVAVKPVSIEFLELGWKESIFLKNKGCSCIHVLDFFSTKGQNVGSLNNSGST